MILSNSSEKALVGTLAEMYVQDVSRRKVKAVTEALAATVFRSAPSTKASTRVCGRFQSDVFAMPIPIIFPNPESCLRLVRALAVEMHENWFEAMRYINMDHLASIKSRC
jgi:transposase-like protein